VRLAKHEYDPGAMIKTIESLLPSTTSIRDEGHLSVNVPNSSLLIRTYPNPFNPDFILEFTLESADELSIDLYDLKGRQVRNVMDQRSTHEGSHTLAISGSNLASGIYLLEVKGINTKVLSKLVKLQ